MGRHRENMSRSGHFGYTIFSNHQMLVRRKNGCGKCHAYTLKHESCGSPSMLRTPVVVFPFLFWGSHLSS